MQTKQSKDNKRKRDLEVGRERREAVLTCLQTLGRDRISLIPLAGRGFQITHSLPGDKQKLNNPNGRGAGDSPYHLGLTVRITDILTQKSKDIEIRVYTEKDSCSSSYLKSISGVVDVKEATAPFKNRAFLNLRVLLQAQENRGPALLKEITHYSLIPIELFEGRMWMSKSKGNKNRVNIAANGFEPNTPINGRAGLFDPELDIISAIIAEINK